MAVWNSVMLSELRGERRMDAEFWQPIYIENERRLLKLPHKTIGGCVTSFRKGIFYILASDYVDSGVPFYRSSNVGEIIPKDSQLAFITEDRDKLEYKTSLRRGDLMLSKTGKNAASVVLCSRCNVSQDVIAVRVNQGIINPFYLAVYLNTTPGQMEMRRWFQGQVQEHLSLGDGRKVIVPIVSENIQRAVQSFIEHAEQKRSDSKDLYREAESILSATLGLDRTDLAPRLFYEDRFSQVAAAGRFDAEYYQPAKWNVLRALAAMKGLPLGEHFRSVRQLWQPDRQAPTCEVRNYDLTDALSPFLDDAKPITTAPEIGSTKKVLKPGDLVISRLRSYLKEIAVVLTSGETPLVGSSEFIVLRQRKTTVSPEALLVFLRSPYVQTILKWSQDGSNHPRFDEKELLAIQVPPIIQDIQDELEQKVKRAFSARQESRRLLETAKHAVEIAIEEGEEAAQNFLEFDGL